MLGKGGIMSAASNIEIDWDAAGGIGLSGARVSGISQPLNTDLLFRDQVYAPPIIEHPITQFPGTWNIDNRDPNRMIVNAIAAVGENNQLALNNRLPWRYPEDLELYHNKVRGKTVIMGRATFESVPNSFHEIPENIIIVSTTMDDSDDDNIHVADTVQEAVGIADDIGAKEVWICGGVRIYKEALEQELIEELHISHIPYEGEADRFFPNFTKYIYNVKEGTTIECEGQPSFVYKIYEMKDSTAELFASLDPGIQYVNNSSQLTATNVQEALEELDRNFGQPDQMVVNPNLMDAIRGVEYTDESNANQPGQVYMNSVDNSLYMINEDGESVMISNIDTGSQTYTETEHERVQRIAHEVVEEFMQQGPTLDESAYHTLNSMMMTKFREWYPEAQVTTNLSIDNSVAPVYTMNRYSPVDYTPSNSRARLNVRVQLLYNSYDLDIELG